MRPQSGSLSVPDGRVNIEASRAADGTLLLRWTEIGGPSVEAARASWFRQPSDGCDGRNQSGEIRFDWRAEGLVCEMTIPPARS